MLTLLFLALGTWLLAALVGAWPSSRHARAAFVSACLTAAACGATAVAAVGLLLAPTEGHLLQLGWSWPLGRIQCGVDELSAFFLLGLSLCSGLASLYAIAQARAGHLSRSEACFFPLLLGGMAGVLIARDGILFVVAWEAMSLAGYFLVVTASANAEGQRAGLVYLIASHLGAAALVLLFLTLGAGGGDTSFEFAARSAAQYKGSFSYWFLLLFVGFGAKAGLWPLHTWLPEAHPVAPSHVSAVMSGVMTKMGIYGLLRILLFFPAVSFGTAATLVALGAISAFVAALHAAVQRDLKRLLAYSTVENVGLVAVGLGFGFVGKASDMPELVVLGFGAALFHVLGHGLFKGLSFLAAGTVLHATHTKNLDQLGGLATRMPRTAVAFLVGTTALSGLPPISGFVTEFLLLTCALRAAAATDPVLALLGLATLVALALTGGLAILAATKAYGISFLGEPRSEAARMATDPPALEILPLLLGAVGCVALGVWPASAISLLSPALRVLGIGNEGLPVFERALFSVGTVALLIIGAASLLWLTSLLLVWRCGKRYEPTWGCGYEHPSPRMQYTAMSYSQPLSVPFDGLLAERVAQEPVSGVFPAPASYEAWPNDVTGERLLLPLLARLRSLVGRLRLVQHGHLQTYLFYVFLTLVAALLWQLATTHP